MAVELVVPSVVQVLLSDEFADVNVAELGGLRQRKRRRCLACAWRSRHQDVRLLPAILRHVRRRVSFRV